MFEPLADHDPRTVGAYRLHARIGAGGMGRVYLGSTPGGRPLAIKIVRPELAADPEFRERFRREVNAAQRVRGPFTAELIDADVGGPMPWLATVYVPALSLQQAVSEHGPLPVHTVWRLLAGMAEALIAIHAAGVIHRDLKPSNVLLAADGPRIIDFGIARAADVTPVTRTGVRVGSPQFMAPEYALGHHLTEAADVFAYGALAVFAATGATPFGEGLDSAVMYRVVNEPPDLDGIADVRLRALAERCLHKEPENRPSLTEIIEECTVDESPLTSEWLPETLIEANQQLAAHPPTPAAQPATAPPPNLTPAEASPPPPNLAPATAPPPSPAPAAALPPNLASAMAPPPNLAPATAPPLSLAPAAALPPNLASAMAPPPKPAPATAPPLNLASAEASPPPPNLAPVNGNGNGNQPAAQAKPARPKGPSLAMPIIAVALVLVAIILGARFSGANTSSGQPQGAGPVSRFPPDATTATFSAATPTSGPPATTPLATTTVPAVRPVVTTTAVPPRTTARPPAQHPAPGGTPQQLGQPDWNGYCQATGRGNARLTTNDAYGWYCTADNTGLDINAVCASTFGHTSGQFTGTVDFYDPNSWQCWLIHQQLGPVDWNGYCQASGRGSATLTANNAYGWYCTGDNNGVDANNACQLQYGSAPGLASFSNFYDQSSWRCWS